VVDLVLVAAVAAQWVVVEEEQDLEVLQILLVVMVVVDI
tara:strand:+ start:307 stop:423 length:117 start_codon:yes stop_codon:yes gene_type:complete